MKSKLILMAALLTTTLHANAAGDDTLKVTRVNFIQKIEKVDLTGFCKVDIVNDSVEYLEFTESSAASLTYKLSGRNLNKLELETIPGAGRAKLHLLMDAAIQVSAEDYALANITCPTSLIKMHVTAEDYGRVTISAQPDADTIRARYIFLQAKDFATISLQSPCTIDSIGLMAEDFSAVNLTYCKGDKMLSMVQDNGKVNVTAHNMLLAEFSTETALSEFESNLFSSEKKTDGSNNSKKEPRKHSYSDGFMADFLWGGHNWGTTPFNGLMKMDGDYALRTTFSSYQIEFTYCPLISLHWRLGIGVGYGSDVYHFSNGHMEITPTGQRHTFSNIPPQADTEWNTRLVARYITLPMTVRWTPSIRNDFFIGLTAIPGINYNGPNTGLKSHKESQNQTLSITDNASNILNPIRMDARLSIGWQHIYGFVQVATIPVNTDMDKNVYPFKVGIAISFNN